MKQVSLKKNLIWLRICIVTALLVILSLFLFSFKAVEQRADDFWKQLGISQQQGSEKIKSSFLNGYLDYWGVRNLKSLSTGNAALITKDLLNYAKAYLNSPAVGDAFEKERLSVKPMAPEAKTISKEAIRIEKIASMRKSIQDSEDLVKKFPDMEKSMRKSIAELEKVIKDYETPESKMIDLFYQSELDQRKQEEERYQRDLKKWQADYPANYKLRIKSQLQKYLDQAATVDFDAALTDKYGKKVFVNPTYERKSSEWKMIYRAGKDVHNVAQPFVKQWVSELH